MRSRSRAHKQTTMDAHLAPIVIGAASPAPPPKRSHHAKKRPLDTAVVCCGPSALEKNAFWTSVENNDAEAVFLFLSQNGALVDIWRKNEGAMSPLLVSKTSAGIPEYQMSASLGVFYRFGFSMPGDSWYILLNDWLGPLQADAKFRVHFLSILERFEKDVKHQPWLLEVMLLAAAEQQNSAVFQSFFPRGIKRCFFDVQPGRLANLPTILQAVIHWQDAKLRRDFVADVLSRCSAAYVVMQTRTRTSMDACNALESAAAIMADPDIVRLLLQRLKTDNTGDVCGDMAAGALKLSLSRLSSGKCTLTPQVAETHALLMECLDERRLGGFHEHFAELRHSVLYLRSQPRSPHSPHASQFASVVDMLSRCEGVLRVVTESAMHKQAAVSNAAVWKYEVEQDAFQDRLEAHVVAAKHTQALAEENELLKSRLCTMQSLLQKQAHLVLAIKRQAQQIDALKDAQEPEMQDLFDSPFVQEMETRLLKLQLPAAPTTVPSSSFSAVAAEDEFYAYLAKLDALALRVPGNNKSSTHAVALPLATDGKNVI